MKAKNWRVSVILVSLACAGCTARDTTTTGMNTTTTGMATTTPGMLNIVKPVVTLVVNGPQGTLTPLNSVHCPASAKIGCVQFDPGELGTITFKIQNGGAKDKTCTSNPKPAWVITKIQLTAYESTTPGKGDYSNTQLAPGWLTDAFPALNGETGVVYGPDKDSATSSAVITDWNNHDKAEGVKILYYKVWGNNCDSDNPVVTDPMVRNGGK